MINWRLPSEYFILGDETVFVILKNDDLSEWTMTNVTSGGLSLRS